MKSVIKIDGQQVYFFQITFIVFGIKTSIYYLIMPFLKGTVLQKIICFTGIPGIRSLLNSGRK